MKQIFSAFTAVEAHFVRLWVDSWAARGWEPQILSAKEVAACGSVKQAAIRRGGKHAEVAPLCALNFNCPVTAKKPLRPVRYGKRGWLSAGLVRFPVDMTEDRMADCGRTLCLAH